MSEQEAYFDRTAELDGATTSPTYDTITGYSAVHDYSALFGYTLQVLRMVVRYPDNENMRQQALDLIQAADDNAEGQAR